MDELWEQVIYEELKERLNVLSEDLRLEVILGELIGNEQLDEKKINIHPVGIFERGYNKDIKECEIRLDDFDRPESVNFKLVREGIYDALPTGIFHRPTKRKYKKSAEEIREEILLQEAEEKAARDFFQPIEQEFYRQRLYLEKTERQVTQVYSQQLGQQLFVDSFWGLDLDGIPEEQASTLLHFLPLAYKYKGDLAEAADIFSTVLQYPIHIETVEGFEQSGTSISPRIGESFLGRNMVLGETFFDGISAIRIWIGPIRSIEIRDFMEGGSHHKLLQIMQEYFLPMEAEIEHQFIIEQKDQHFELETADHQARLGYTTFL